jgi:hypothetical protein
MIAFARAKYGNDLILADLNLAVGWSIRQTAKFSGYTVYTYAPINFEEVRYIHVYAISHHNGDLMGKATGSVH